MIPEIETFTNPAVVYWIVFILMTIESSFIPFPSEVIMVPAGYLAAKGVISIPIAILMGALGSLAGSTINYYLAYFIGKPFLSKYGKYIFLPPERFEKLNTFFKKYGRRSTFFGRFIPWIRQLISIPAGLSKMSFLPFAVYTTIGAGIWVSVLVYLGFSISKLEEAFYYSSVIGKAVGIAIVLVLLILVFAPKLWFKFKKDK